MTYDLICERKGTPIRLSNPRDAYAAFGRYARARTERFVTASLNGAHDIIKVRIITIGLINRTIVHPREIFRPAILDGAVALVIGHNHPSNRLDPSPEDLAITRRLRDAGELIGIPVLDHIIFGRDGFVSFVERGLIPPATLD